MFRSAIEKAGLELVVSAMPLASARLRGPGDVGKDRAESAVERVQVHVRGRITVRAAIARRSRRPARGRYRRRHSRRPIFRACSSDSTASSTVAPRTHEGTGIGLALVQELARASRRRRHGRPAQEGRGHDVHRDHSDGDGAPAAGRIGRRRHAALRRAMAPSRTSKKRFAGCPTADASAVTGARVLRRTHGRRCHPPTTDGAVSSSQMTTRTCATISDACSASTIASKPSAMAAPPLIASAPTPPISC